MEDYQNPMDFVFSPEIMRIANPNYEPRPSQIEAARRIRRALDNSSHFILEGSCGFGKTYAYLAPIVQHMCDHDEAPRAVLVTNGISLQEQLYYQDVPSVISLFQSIHPEKKISYTLLKGRSNYVCLSKIAELAHTHQPMTPETRDLVRRYKESGSLSAEDLDISSFDYVPDFGTLKDIACVDAEECHGKDCGFYGECAYQANRRRAKTSNIVITNYHMLFTGYKSGISLFDEYDILVFDEAHDIQNVFRDFLEEKISIYTFENLNRKLVEMARKDDSLSHLFSREQLNYTVQKVTNYFQHVQRTLFFDPNKEESKLIKADIPLCMYDEGKRDMAEAVESLMSIFNNIEEQCEESGNKEDPTVIQNYFKAVAAKESLRRVWETLLSHETLLEDDNMAMWVRNSPYDFSKKQEKGLYGVSVHTKPVSVAKDMLKGFLSSETSCIFTSATLSVGGNFNYLKEAVGISLLEDHDPDRGIDEFIGESPFDLSEQELWYLSENAMDGNDKAFPDYLPSEIVRIIEATNGGALCLFTSYYNLNKVSSAIKEAKRNGRLSKIRFLEQNTMPKMRILEEFRNDPDSCVLATKSFFQGVDVPGDSLRALILDKFPFPSPVDPIMIKLNEKYGSRSFQKVFIPEMIISLKQAVGRGVRSVNDRCVVAILDGRLSSASYKTKIFKSFPYKKRGARTIEEIEAFLKGE